MMKRRSSRHISLYRDPWDKQDYQSYACEKFKDLLSGRQISRTQIVKRTTFLLVTQRIHIKFYQNKIKTLGFECCIMTMMMQALKKPFNLMKRKQTRYYKRKTRWNQTKRKEKNKCISTLPSIWREAWWSPPLLRRRHLSGKRWSSWTSVGCSGHCNVTLSVLITMVTGVEAGDRHLLASHISISSFLHRGQDTGHCLIMIHWPQACHHCVSRVQRFWKHYRTEVL